jgi:hypothetical protein
MTPRIARAAQAQREAIDLAVARGDVAEETARRRSLSDIERRQRRTEAWTSETAAAFTKAIRQLDPKDGIRRLVVLQHLEIGLAQLHTALILRDHMNGGASGASELMERVDGGRVHNGQMEGMVDRRRPLRAACDAAREAVTDEKLMPVAMEVILYARSPRAACDRHGVTWGGQMPGRISAAIAEALDAAAANVGVAR